jgi:hypothetical protein
VPFALTPPFSSLVHIRWRTTTKSYDGGVGEGVSVGRAGVKVAEGVSVGGTDVSVGLTVGVREGVEDGVSVGANVGVSVGVGTGVLVGAGLGVSVGNGGLGDGVGVDVSCEATNTSVLAAAGWEADETEPGVGTSTPQPTSNITTNVTKLTWGRCVLGTIPFPLDE